MSTIEHVITQLSDIVGVEHVLVDVADRELYSMDIWTRGTTAAAVVQPADAGQLAAVVKLVTAAGYPVIGRGAGMSYTKGYTPVEENTFIIDCLRMNRVIEVNQEDMYVTVEAGCTWKKLHDTLKGTGVRTPFWGTLSGLKATVGGGISQNSVFWGTGQYGSAVDSVVSMDVVLADGTVVSTGSAAQQNGTPFFRHFGPDLTGIFCCDCGALGIKATVTLRLVPELPAQRFVSFNFEDHASIVGAMNAIARQGLAMQCFGFDPALTEMRAQRDSLVSDAKAFAGVLKESKSVFSAVKDGMKIALAGRRFMKDLQWPCYVMIEERSEAAADAALKEVMAIGKKYNAKEVENSIPKIIRANPFAPLNNMIGPGGERWAPVHALAPLSKVTGLISQIQDMFARNQADIDKHGITTGFLLATVSTNCFTLEPLFFWPDAADEIQKVSVEQSFYNRVAKLPPNPEARAVVERLREAIIDIFTEAGCSHLQIGKSYRYANGLKAPSFALAQGLKKLVDPNNRMNPGALGFTGE